MGITRTSNKVPVSLRIPSALSDEIESYAAKHGMRKTDAYIHFLQQGMKSLSDMAVSRKLDDLQEQISDILGILKAGNGASESSVAVREAIKSVSAQYPAVKRAYLFGSFARGSENPESDIDIRLEIDRSKRFNLHDLSHFMKQIEQITGRQCDVVTADPIKSEPLANAIERDKELVYERSAE